jgi:hypothetical protein
MSLKNSGAQKIVATETQGTGIAVYVVDCKRLV